MEYVARKDADRAQPEETARLLAGGQGDCFLCRDAVATPSLHNLVALQTTHAVAVLNRYPYNNGHLLVAPRRHTATLDLLTRDEQHEIHDLLVRLIQASESILQSDGFNVGLNLGKAAGAGVPGHLHWHLVPRWNGDHNFMAATAQTRVISQSLEAFWTLLTEALNSPA